MTRADLPEATSRFAGWVLTSVLLTIGICTLCPAAPDSSANSGATASPNGARAGEAKPAEPNLPPRPIPDPNLAGLIEPPSDPNLVIKGAQSPVMHGGQKAQMFSVDITDRKMLVLTTRGYSWGQAVWGDPVLVDKNGKKINLTILKPVSVLVGWGAFTLNNGPNGKPTTIADQKFHHSMFAAADSTLVFLIDGKYKRFESYVGVNDTARKSPAAVTFEVKNQDFLLWQYALAQAKRGFTRQALSAYHRELADARTKGPEPAARADELDRRLDAFDRDFDSLRKELDANAPSDTIKDRVTELKSIISEIHLMKLDAPLLINKRHAYMSPHIYDDFLTYRPGGGIYIIENPWAEPNSRIVRPVVDCDTPQTLGYGIYRDPDISYNAKKMLFAFKFQPQGDTSIHEINLDGSGLHRLTYPGQDCPCKVRPSGLVGFGQHDYSPCYLPDGRIAFVSTRTEAVVMCFSSYIATLHTMNGDGSNIRCISANNVSEFDPTMLPDGRILYGRWEYVDKTALYMQSLWTVNPDGTGEAALFKNNLAKPTAVLDARPVPGSDLIAASLTPHNGQSVGAIAMIDPRAGKNNLDAITNFTPEFPTEMDQGLKFGPSDPWPLSENFVLIANNTPVHGPHSVIELIDRWGFRTTICSDPKIGCFAPMLVKPSEPPPIVPSKIQAGTPARFMVHDVYRGMDGVKPGEIKQLRILETTARVSGIPKGGRWWNQAFLVSWQGSYDIKNFIGVVPVEEDGSAYFEAPAGKALYFQALDKDGRLVQSMRTFIQAAPGVTRSCVGCHVKEDNEAPVGQSSRDLALQKEAATIQPETWGSGFLSYHSRIQPILDKHCVRCHGGTEGIGGGIDLSGGWTWAFNISYETLLKNTQTGFLNCHNFSVKTSEILPPRTHGSGVAPLAGQLLAGHKGRIPGVTREEIARVLAWMDENCNYYGTWDYTEFATCEALGKVRDPLLAQMDKAGCVKCHAREIGNDWVNLQTPEHSRILRAPLARTSGGLGLEWCRDRKARPVRTPLVNSRVLPPDVFKPARDDAPTSKGTTQGAPVTPFADSSNAFYQAMLTVIQKAREDALKTPRVDMPGANIIEGRCRQLAPLARP